jgi:hypothetical protein
MMRAADAVWLQIVEFAFWVIFAGRVVEEGGQVFDDGVHQYLSRFWNRIDLAMIITQGGAFVLRVQTKYLESLRPEKPSYAWGPPSPPPPWDSKPTGQSSTSTGNTALGASARGAPDWMLQVQFDFQVRSG